MCCTDTQDHSILLALLYFKRIQFSFQECCQFSHFSFCVVTKKNGASGLLQDPHTPPSPPHVSSVQLLLKHASISTNVFFEIFDFHAVLQNFFFFFKWMREPVCLITSWNWSLKKMVWGQIKSNSMRQHEHWLILRKLILLIADNRRIFGRQLLTFIFIYFSPVCCAQKFQLFTNSTVSLGTLWH